MTQYSQSIQEPFSQPDDSDHVENNHWNVSAADRLLLYDNRQRELKKNATNGTYTAFNDNSHFELDTLFQGSDGNNGAMFDLSSPNGTHTVKIWALDINVNIVDPACRVLVYGHKGTHVGVESSPLNWTLLFNASVVCAGFGQRTHIPLGESSIVMEGGQIYSLYTRLRNPTLRYDIGHALGSIYSSTEFLAIHEGTGLSAFFGNQLARPRVWNGAVFYQVHGLDIDKEDSMFSTGCENTLTTTFNDNLGSYGMMFDIVTYSSAIDIFGISLYTDVFDYVSYDIYTRKGSYVDGQKSLLNWTVVKTGTTTRVGEGTRNAHRLSRCHRTPKHDARLLCHLLYC